MQRRKEEPMPNCWGVDSDGKETKDPNKVMDGGGLLYLGGTEETGGYKGYGLGMMVEIMGGILGGGPYGTHIRKWQKDDRVADLVRALQLAYRIADSGLFSYGNLEHY